MEENVMPTEVTTSTETVTTPVETTAVTATTASRSKLPYIILAVVALAAIAVAAVLILTQQNTVVNNTPDGSGFNVRNPEAATAKLNESFPSFYSMLTDSAIGGEFDKTFGALGGGSVKAVQLKMTVNTKVGDQGFQVGIAAKTNPRQTEGTVSLGGQIEGFGPLNLDVDFASIAAEESYFQLKGLPAETAAMLTQVGLAQNKWYRIPAGILENTSDLTSSVEENSGLEAFKDIQDRLDGQPLFINPKAVAGRTVYGANLDCMTIEINPAIGIDVETIKSLEICNNDTILPVYLGVVMDQDGSEMSFSIEMAEANDFTLTAPAGAVEATFLTDFFEGFMQGFGGNSNSSGSSSDSMLRYDPETMTPEEYQEYLDIFGDDLMLY